MSMMDLMQQGGAPPDAPPEDPYAGGAPSGDPMSALMGAAPGGAPEEAPPEEGAPDDGGDESSDYQSAIDALTSALNRPTTDQQEMAEIQKCIASIQGLLGKNEKMMDSALGTNPQLRKALAGGGAG
jgi:hypothetical protein